MKNRDKKLKEFTKSLKERRKVLTIIYILIWMVAIPILLFGIYRTFIEDEVESQAITVQVSQKEEPSYIYRNLDKEPCNVEVVDKTHENAEVRYCHTVIVTKVRIWNTSIVKKWGFYPRDNLSRFIEINGTECSFPCNERIVFCYNDDCSQNCTTQLPISAVTSDVSLCAFYFKEIYGEI